MRRLQGFKIIPINSSTLLREAEPSRAVGVHHVFHPPALLFGTDARVLESGYLCNLQLV